MHISMHIFSQVKVEMESLIDDCFIHSNLSNIWTGIFHAKSCLFRPFCCQTKRSNGGVWIRMHLKKKRPILSLVSYEKKESLLYTKKNDKGLIQVLGWIGSYAYLSKLKGFNLNRVKWLLLRFLFVGNWTHHDLKARIPSQLLLTEFLGNISGNYDYTLSVVDRWCVRESFQGKVTSLII